jgi:two-component system, NarL family, nitrate/nitrite response regulator NarL
LPFSSTPIDTEPIRLLLVDDHGLFREGLARVMEAQPDFKVAGKTSTVAEALELIGKDTFDVVLLDVDLGAARGIEFVHEAKTRQFTGRILIVTAGVSDLEAIQYVQGGVSGILHKHNPPEALWAAVRKVARGEVHLEPGYLKAMFETLNAPDGGAGKRLTDREISVLRRLLRGLANKEIGSELGVSEASVKATLQGLFDKLGVRTRSQLVKVALEQYRDYL